MKLANIKIVLYLVSILFSAICFAQYRELYVPGIPQEIFLKMSDSDFIEYQEDIQSISNSHIANIEKSKKKYFPIIVRYQSESKNNECNAQARITGDWQDHIRVTDKITSLKIQLKDCFIGGISKFRLLFPETKNGSSEIFWSMLLNEYGFPTLYTQMVNVRLNNVSYKALLQEMPTTAFLERHGIREAPIIEADEQQMWGERAHWFYHAYALNAPRHDDPDSPFGFWLDDKNFAYGEFRDFGHLNNKEFASNRLKSQIAMRGISQYIANRSVQNSNFFDQINILWATHGMVPHNRKFIYIPVTNNFIPLYYDGMVDLNQSQAVLASKAPNFSFDGCSETTYEPSEAFSREFRRRSQEELSDQMKCVYERIHSNFANLLDWSNETIDNGKSPIIFKFPEVDKASLKTAYKGIYQDMLMMKMGNYFLCKSNETSQICEQINFKDAHRIMIKGQTIQIDDHKFVGTVVSGEFDSNVKSRGMNIETPTTYSINVAADEKYYLHVMQGNGRNINIHLQGPGSRAVVYGELRDLDVVSVSGNAPNLYKESRHDELLLTGCVTFLNTTFDNPTLSSSATGCEDAINILHSNGRIKNISIQNATEDALDVDFSNLQIERIDVKGAGNDCLDISTGNYEIGTAILKNCGDKGVSAGEYANIKLDKVVVDGSNLGLVAKDGAFLMANEFKGFNIKEKCIDAYIKKKRFPIGHAYSLSKSCELAPKP